MKYDQKTSLYQSHLDAANKRIAELEKDAKVLAGFAAFSPDLPTKFVGMKLSSAEMEQIAALVEKYLD